MEKLAEKAHLQIPGDEETRPNRLSGVGALQGIASGVGIGALLGVLRRLGLRPALLPSGVGTALGVMALTDGTMTALGVTDPRRWSTTDWASDLLPHLAYGLVTAATLEALED